MSDQKIITTDEILFQYMEEVDQLNERIAELEASDRRAALLAKQNSELRKRIAALEAELAALRDLLERATQDICDPVQAHTTLWGAGYLKEQGE